MQSEMIGYKWLRRLIGIVGLALPFVLIIVNAIVAPGPLPGSISAYYYSSDATRNILVGAMCAVGVFLSTYRGYDRDYIPVRIAAIFSTGVAWFPTLPADPDTFDKVIGILHGIFAGLMFLSLAYISIFLFTRTKPWNVKTSKVMNEDKTESIVTMVSPIAIMTPRKIQRNYIYRTCGIVMLVAMVLIPVLTRVTAIDFLHPMYWLETVVIVAFGISWLVKGETILRDR